MLKGLFDKLKAGLRKTRDGLVAQAEALLQGRAVDAGLLDELEELLVAGDVGVAAARRILEPLRAGLSRRELRDADHVRALLRAQILGLLEAPAAPGAVASPAAAGTPHVILVLGVNGSGKTTTIAKLARRFLDEGRRVLLAAGDTFRAAAIEQLQAWGQRLGVPVVAHQAGADPSAVAFDAARAAAARGVEVLLVDTAGRLHTKRNLMEELKKLRRVLGREIPGAPHERLMVLDATTGTNAIAQAREFHAAVGLTGLVLTKLDGTAKGGVVLGIRHELNLPVCYVGVGEALDDLQPFDPQAFVEALFAPPSA
jgi:fused signal recognition particle receptor